MGVDKKGGVMTTYSENRAFIQDVISSSLLEDSIAWITSRFSPEEVFGEQALEDWATEHGFKKVEEDK